MQADDGGTPAGREPVAGECGACGSEQLERYPVLSEGGWFLVVKCRHCLETRDRVPWQRLGHVTRTTGLS